MTDAPHHPWQSNQAGFTLVEILVVLAMIALAAAVAMPQALGSRQRLALEAAAIDIASEMKSARAAAIRTNTEQTLTIDTVSRRYTRDGWTEARTLPGQFTVALDTIRTEQTGSAAGRIRFYPDGSATGGRVILSSGPRRAVVAIDWLTGGSRVSVER